MFTNDLDPLAPITILSVFTYISFISFETSNLLRKSKIFADRSSRLLLISPHLSKLIING